jgi:hypothetical protein
LSLGAGGRTWRAAGPNAWRGQVPSLHQLRQHLQDRERERDRLANRIRLQRTRPLPALLGDELDPDEQAMITAAGEDDLDRAR